MRIVHTTWALALVASCASNTSSTEQEGATFTTTEDGDAVNDNIYDSKEDVYLDGGPGGNAPSTAAALPEGDYYFQVTEPAGKTLLSSDDLECRRFHLTADGIIDTVIGSCAHATGIDSDHGGLTVQLFPYADTPNNGGVYKLWVTAVADIGNNGEFRHNKSKTDNFKVVPSESGGDDDDDDDDDDDCPEEPVCGDGHLDQGAGEACDDGNTAGGDGCDATCQVEVTPEPCCGDGHLDAGEDCDDGNTLPNDGCDGSCKIESCPVNCPQ